MNRHFTKLVYLLLSGLYIISLSLLTSNVSAKEMIRWHQMDYPPLYFLQGPNKGNGAAEILQRMLIERLGSEFQHTSVVVNDARSRHESKKGVNACFVGGVYKDSDYYSSIPVVAIYPHLLVIRKDNRGLFSQASQISLNELLRNEGLILGLQKDRSRGALLNAIIETHAHQKNVQTSGLYTLQNLLKMISHGRIHYTIDYSYWIQNSIQQTGLDDQFDFIPIKENQETIMRGGVVCTRNEWGKKIIQRIDEILVDLRPRPEYKKIFSDLGYIPRGLETEFWDMYNQQVLQVE